MEIPLITSLRFVARARSSIRCFTPGEPYQGRTLPTVRSAAKASQRDVFPVGMGPLEPWTNPNSELMHGICRRRVVDFFVLMAPPGIEVAGPSLWYVRALRPRMWTCHIANSSNRLTAAREAPCEADVRVDTPACATRSARALGPRASVGPPERCGIAGGRSHPRR
jgi:hypothetical protein